MVATETALLAFIVVQAAINVLLFGLISLNAWAFGKFVTGELPRWHYTERKQHQQEYDDKEQPDATHGVVSPESHRFRQ